jgi:plastocyanin
MADSIGTASGFAPGALLLALVVVLGVGSQPAAAATINGEIELSYRGKALRGEELREAVVYFRPRVPVAASAGQYEMRMKGKRFEPAVLAVGQGSSVRFPNADPILHNVFSPTGDNRFDLGVYGAGDGADHVFEEPGLVRVYCNVHHEMFAHILVLDTPHVTRPQLDGSFSLEGIDSVDGELFVWHERARPWRRKLDAVPETPLSIEIKLRRPRVPEHMNKFGQPYDGSAEYGY